MYMGRMFTRDEWEERERTKGQREKEFEEKFRGKSFQTNSFEEFVSPVDGRVIRNRQDLKDHNKELGVHQSHGCYDSRLEKILRDTYNKEQ